MGTISSLKLFNGEGAACVFEALQQDFALKHNKVELYSAKIRS
jgi:hypothetical protein